MESLFLLKPGGFLESQKNMSKGPYDNIFLWLSFSVIASGLFILTSASLGLSTSRFGYPYYYLIHQVIVGLIPGLVLMYGAYRTPYKFWRNLALPLLLASIFLMFLVFVPKVGFFYGGAKRWISIGGLSFQPSEFLKFSFILYLAVWLESRSRQIKSIKFGLLPFSIMSAFIASFLVFQPDIGTLLVLLASVLALYFLSGGEMRQILALFLVGAVLMGGLLFVRPYTRSRVATFLDPSSDVAGKGYQINQAFIAVGSGGLFGRGFGLSRQKFNYLPEPIGDSVFAVFSEEMGFLGGLLLLALFFFIFVRGFTSVLRAHDLFGQLLGSGILFLIIFQVLINVSAIVGLMPLTGIPLSFVSYGGSALALMLGELGIILNISKSRA